MPTAAPVFRPPGTRHGTDRQYSRRAYDKHRRETQPFRAWYKLAAWQRRRTAQFASEPLCSMCKGAGVVKIATIADHIIPHRGNWELFIGGELQSLCKRHHDSDKRSEENRRDPNR